MTKTKCLGSMCTAAFAMLFMASLAVAQNEVTDQQPGHKGEFVNATNNKLTMSINGDQQHSHTVTANTKVTINGRQAELSDLREGDQIRVVTNDDNEALSIRATRQSTAQRNQRDSQEGRNQRAQGGDAFLGIATEESRGGGVYIPDVAPQGPAEEAGIRPRDYILSIDGKKVSSPQQLDQVLADLQPNQQVDIVIWRNRQKQTVNVQLGDRQRYGFRGDFEDGNAPPADDDFQAGQTPKTWLGAMIEDNDDQGVRIEQIHPQGPAAKAQLQEGDVILSINDKKATDSNAVGNMIANMKPGSQAEMVILRNNQKQNVTVTLTDGSRFMNSGRQFGGGFRSSFNWENSNPEDMLLEQHRHFANQHQRIEELCQQLLQEVKDLRQEVQMLRGDRADRGATRPAVK